MTESKKIFSMKNISIKQYKSRNLNKNRRRCFSLKYLQSNAPKRIHDCEPLFNYQLSINCQFLRRQEINDPIIFNLSDNQIYTYI